MAEDNDSGFWNNLARWASDMRSAENPRDAYQNSYRMLQSFGLEPEKADQFALAYNKKRFAAGGDVDPPEMVEQTVDAAKDVVPPVRDPVAIAKDVMAGAAAKKAPKPQVYNFPTPEAQARQIMQQNASAGLQFPEEDGMKRLAAKMKRMTKVGAGDPANERTVIKAPSPDLPDFVTGKITPKDWVARHEKILNDDEIHKAATWYKGIYDEFSKYYKDPAEIKKNMRAWLVAQQNVSPEGAMKNVLLQREQMARNVPKELWKAGGMPNPTEAARAVLQGQEITGGVGQKIADFVDSAEGKRVRSWMANHPDGGSPFVVDVHTARDTGMVDQELINHLTRLGYNKDALAKLKIDLTGTPTEAAYENRSQFGHQLTDHLNRIGWKGRKDWSPEEVQAIGWMGMTKLTRDTEPTAESGLGRNYRRISYEIDPGEASPWAAKYGTAIGDLTPEEKADLTAKIAHKAMDHASKLAGIDVHDLVHGTGAWEQYQNPAAVAQGLMHPTGGDIAANALGYLLNQTEVWHNNLKPMTSAPKAFGIDFVENGSKNLENPEYLKGFWQQVMDADDTGLFKGFQPIRTPDGRVGIRALVDKGGVKTQNALEKAISEGGSIHSMLKSMDPDFEVSGHEAEISKHRNDWKEQPNGEGYLERLEHLLGSNPKSQLDKLRSQLEKELEGHLAGIQKARGTQKGTPEVMARGGRTFGLHPVHKVPGIHIITADAGEPVFTGEK